MNDSTLPDPIFTPIGEAGFDQLAHNLNQLKTLSSLDGVIEAEAAMSQARQLFSQMKEIGNRLSSAYDHLLQLQIDSHGNS